VSQTPPARLCEEDILRLAAELTAGAGPADGVAVGVGDDAAVLAVGGARLAVTTDMMVEGVHFDLAYASPRDVGWRVMAANLSDLAAMGATPRWGFLSLGLRPGPTPALVEGLFDGMLELARTHGLRLVGGDTVRAPALTLNLCLIGLCESGPPALRSTARAGQAVCVSGPLGASAAGLAWLSAGRDRADALAAPAVEAHLRPRPRLALGRALAASGRLGAMMDLSDGLASDLARLCAASGVGARLEAARLPVAGGAAELAPLVGADAVDWALRGGEDFELLFTCQQTDVAELARLAAQADPGAAVVKVGALTKGRGVWLLGLDGSRTEVGLQGFDHFRGDGQ